MGFIVRCGCGTKLQAEDEHAGRKVKCSACGRTLLIPAEAPKDTPKSLGQARKAGDDPKVLVLRARTEVVQKPPPEPRTPGDGVPLPRLLNRLPKASQWTVVEIIGTIVFLIGVGIWTYPVVRETYYKTQFPLSEFRSPAQRTLIGGHDVGHVALSALGSVLMIGGAAAGLYATHRKRTHRHRLGMENIWRLRTKHVPAHVCTECRGTGRSGFFNTACRRCGNTGCIVGDRSEADPQEPGLRIRAPGAVGSFVAGLASFPMVLLVLPGLVLACVAISQ